MRRSRGFTLIELLIVVIIIAILAAIAIPQFSSSTSDAQSAALDANLATLRTAIEQYKVQHNNTYPGATTSTGTCPGTSKNYKGDLDSGDAFSAQLQYYTNAAGVACDVANADFKYGPYLRQGVPAEPVKSQVAVSVKNTGAVLTADNSTGWMFDDKSGQFIMNNSAMDTNSPQRAWSAH
ncbi:prepilin-type N-terminal cleavage/methylation domain-containing protein [Massilia sp. 9096]|uniref:prepilin-type N-terminal cleavage/methylation domain-containing protein n=1 Tax=Massilia sp. 9096 TaxID=1500894 RepID=UPI000AB0E992|nr:prepilin-type N-terminal cleavage/methylation domain-containing protein [Massilia sp. 9096]